jgi:hypothetical protein
MNTPKILSDCNIDKIETDITDTNEKLKKLNKYKKQCKSFNFKDEYKKAMTLKELQEIIVKENKENVDELLDLFVDTRDKIEGVSTTKNHVYEALWILVYLHKLDNFNEAYKGIITRQFYRSLEKGIKSTKEEVLEEKVAAGASGGIADIYFEIHGDKNSKENKEAWCEGDPPEVFNRYLCSVKYYGKEKNVQSYDIADICVEASNKFKDGKYNILLLVKNGPQAYNNIKKSQKELVNRFHKIYDMSDLNILYKKLKYGLEKGDFNKQILLNPLKPRFHQTYFVDYTKKCINKNFKNFIWGAVPRSGKSFMIGGLIAKEQPKIVILYLGAITETKDQFIKMFKEHEDFKGYEIHDTQKGGDPLNKGKSKKIIVMSQEKGRTDVANIKISDLPKIIKDTLNEKDKLVFFDEIHQGSGPKSLQEGMLNAVVFDNPYKAFIMVTATFAKPYIKYMNKDPKGVKLLNWNYDMIQSMKEINKTDTDDFGIDTKIIKNQLIENIKNEDDGEEKSKIFLDILQDLEKQGVSLEILEQQYKIYPELIVSTPTISENTSNFMIEKNIDVYRIFKPLLKSELNNQKPCVDYINYIWDNIYEKFLLRKLNFNVTNPHTQLWFMPTVLRDDKGTEDIIETDITMPSGLTTKEQAEWKKKNKKPGPFSNMCKHFTELLMKHEKFKHTFCVMILHSTGLHDTEIEFLNPLGNGGKKPTWSKVSVSSDKNGCVSTKCNSDKDLKHCILQEEANAKNNGKSLIILTGKMLRLGISLPCVDIALHMDPIKSVDTIYQSMFRVLTERKGKKFGVFIDMLTSRQISFMYQYMNYTTPKISLDTHEKAQKKLLEKLLLFGYNGINHSEGKEYQQMYNDLMNDFYLNDKQKFSETQNIYQISEASELLQNPEYDELINQFYSILQKLGIEYNDKKATYKKDILKKGDSGIGDDYEPGETPPQKDTKKQKVEEIDIKFKRQEIVNFMNDFITLFILFKKNNKELTSKNVKTDFTTFFNQKITDITELCSQKINDDDNTLNCHLLFVLMSKVGDDKVKLDSEFKIFKSKIKEFFIELMNKDEFMTLYNARYNDIKLIEGSTKQMISEKPCSDKFIKNENVLELIRKRLTIRKEQKDLFGEVFTPIELICEMLEKIPDEVWKNPDLKWLDPANGIGNFPVVVYYKLMESLKDKIQSDTQRSRHIIENMLYMVELNPVNSKVCEKIFHMIDPKSIPNIITGSFIKGESYKKIIDFKFKFNVIIGNPPFQYKKDGNFKSQTIWDRFITKSIEYLEDGGYLSLINPTAWHAPTGNFKNILDIFLKYNLIYLNTNGFSQKEFNVGTAYDYYVLQKNTNYDKTIINDIDNKDHIINLKRWDFIPNGGFDIFEKILSLGNEQKVKILYSSNNYETRSDRSKNPTSKNKTTKFLYYIINSITQKDGPKYIYSSIKDPSVFVPKVIWSNGLGTYPIIDKSGEYGLTQFAYGIVDDVENLESIKKAMESTKFIDLMKYVKYTNNKYNYKIIGLFKKDFYKYFLDDEESPYNIGDMLETPTDFYKSSPKIKTFKKSNKTESKTKKKKCPNGQRRNKKTGLCEPK